MQHIYSREEVIRRATCAMDKIERKYKERTAKNR